MLLEFATLQLTHEELKEIYRALYQRAESQHLLMHEKGTEHPDHTLLHRVQDLLGKSEEELEQLHEDVDMESWEFAWFSYTEEWAWYRARQDAEKALGRALTTSAEDEAQEEAMYHKNFEAYIQEIAMIPKVVMPESAMVTSKTTATSKRLPKKRQRKAK